ncbi:MAG: hypothetical protein MUE65_02830, partial [Methanomassiliicoccales archaeon]|nr:hypothetical protein [Methanomassiliicoccales archaeon]
MGGMDTPGTPARAFADREVFAERKGGAPCSICKGSRNMCGKPICPLMVKFYSHMSTKRLIDSLDLAGSCPPGVFVGRYGYPKV